MSDYQGNPLPLFQRYPALAKAIPWTSLANLPTAVESFNATGIHTPGTANLWIKRDDKSSDLYGGNKIRKLEFALSEARQQGKTKLLTFGAIGTNHGVATALFCQKLGISCKVLLFDQPVTQAVKDNLLLMQSFGASLEYKGSLFRAALSFYTSRLLDSSDTYYLFAGGSNVAGCVGFVNAAFELGQQIQQGLIPEPDIIFCPVGSNGTVAGLTLGCRLAGLQSQVIGVRVAPARLGIFPVCTTKSIQSLMAQTYKFLRQMDNSVPVISLPEVHLDENYYGEGYGHSLTMGIEATEVFGRAGIKLEPTYTAKTAAAVLKHCAKHPKQKVLYWYTYNSSDMSEFLAKADINDLPTVLRQVAML